LRDGVSVAELHRSDTPSQRLAHPIVEAATVIVMTVKGCILHQRRRNS
jgi:hypothetical protein